MLLGHPHKLFLILPVINEWRIFSWYHAVLFNIYNGGLRCGVSYKNVIEYIVVCMGVLVCLCLCVFVCFLTSDFRYIWGSLFKFIVNIEPVIHCNVINKPRGCFWTRYHQLLLMWRIAEQRCEFYPITCIYICETRQKCKQTNQSRGIVKDFFQINMNEIIDYNDIIISYSNKEAQ